MQVGFFKGVVLGSAALLLLGASCARQPESSSPSGGETNVTGEAAVNVEVVSPEPPVVQPGMIEAEAQKVVNSQVVIKSAILPRAGFVVIHQSQNGGPGPVIGHAAIKEGTNENVRVTVSADKLTPEVFAMLHHDRGNALVYEFPGTDEPVVFNGQPVMVLIKVTTDAKPKAAAEEKKTTTPVVEVETEIKTEVKTEVVIPETKVIAVSAKQWEFSPATITVKKGTKVTLNITSSDVAHGFDLSAFNVSANLEPGKTASVTFMADKTGTFPFFCSVFCGSGHGGMQGKLVVE